MVVVFIVCIPIYCMYTYLKKSYLTNTMHYIHFQKVNSSEECIICGVPQGFILGPLIFISYVNSQHGTLKDSYCIVFADDKNVFIEHSNYAILIDRLNKYL